MTQIEPTVCDVCGGAGYLDDVDADGDVIGIILCVDCGGSGWATDDNLKRKDS